MVHPPHFGLLEVEAAVVVVVLLAQGRLAQALAVLAPGRLIQLLVVLLAQGRLVQLLVVLLA